MRPPIARILLVALLFTLLGALPAEAKTPYATKAETARICTNGTHRWLKPSAMATNFKQGDYCNASGKNLPDWVYTKAKEWYRNHPAQAPGCAAPGSCTDTKQRGDGWDWSFIEWLKKPLTTGRCLGWNFAPAKWVGCKSQPDWVHATRRVTFFCGGTLVLVAALSRSPIAAFSAGAGCAWKALEGEYAGSWRQLP